MTSSPRSARAAWARSIAPATRGSIATSPSRCRATEFSERFSREARSIAALNHSNVCHLYDVGPNYLVLEYVEGENLVGPMSFDEALPIVRQLIDGIEAAHEKNIIHRDLKTANIRITPEGVVKILDFGLAKAAEPESMRRPRQLAHVHDGRDAGRRDPRHRRLHAARAGQGQGRRPAQRHLELRGRRLRAARRADAVRRRRTPSRFWAR